MNDRAVRPAVPVGAFTPRQLEGLALCGRDVASSFFFLIGDANRDRSVNLSDFSILASRFNQGGNFTQGDFNHNGVVDIGDFAILASKFNTTLPAARPAMTASLPASSRVFGSRFDLDDSSPIPGVDDAMIRLLE